MKPSTCTLQCLDCQSLGEPGGKVPSPHAWELTIPQLLPIDK